MNDTDRPQSRSGYSELLGYRFTRHDTDYCEIELTVH